MRCCRLLSFPLLSAIVAAVAIALTAAWLRRAFEVPIIDTSDKFEARQITGPSADQTIEYWSRRLRVDPADQAEPDQ